MSRKKTAPPAARPRLSDADREELLRAWWRRTTGELQTVADALDDVTSPVHRLLGAALAGEAAAALRHAADDLANGLPDLPLDLDLPFLE